MNNTGSLLLAIVAVVVVGYFALPTFLFPSGVWHRRVVRDHPLSAPIVVTGIQGGKVVTAKGDLHLAGVTIPPNPVIQAKAKDLLQLATAQGVEVIRTVAPPDVALLRCEPRIWHWCGNDPVAGHFEQFNLNELLIAFGYAKYDGAAAGLTKDERLRLRAAERVAKDHDFGLWNPNPANAGPTYDLQAGLNISDAVGLNEAIDWAARELRKP